MGTVRTLTMLGAALLAGLILDIAPGAARDDCNFIICFPQAQAKAPLNIVQTAKQAPTAREATRKAKKPAQASTKPRAKPVSRTPARSTAHAATRRGAARSAFAQADRNVIRGPDTIALIAMLPWWRSAPMQTIEFGNATANSKVIAAADAWLSQHGSVSWETAADGSMLAHAEAATVGVADPDTANEIDLASAPASPPERTFIQSLIALLGGAAAAAAAGRFLFV